MHSLLQSVQQGLKVHDLSQPMRNGIPRAPVHPEFRLTQGRRHGDTVRKDGTSGSSEVVQTGGHVGTHLDALGHISWMGELHGGVDAAAAQRSGRLSVLGIDEFQPTLCRGILLDVPKVLGVSVLHPAHPISIDELRGALELTGTHLRQGDAVFVRTGWAQYYDDAEKYLGEETGDPGVTEESAAWLADQKPLILGGDTIHFECMQPKVADVTLPVHRLLLVERGIHILEIANFEGIAAQEIYEFACVLAPLNWLGATGAPLRLLAIE